jgi:hypothetical protein
MKTAIIRAKFAAKHLLTVGAGVALSLGLISQASASLLVYEGFDYTVGSSLINQNGGLGFVNSWQTNGSPSAAGSYSASILSGSLAYQDTKGNSLVTTGGKADITGLYGTAQPNRDFALQGADGTTLWMAYVGIRLGPTTNNTGTPFNPYPRGVNVAFFSNATEQVSIGNYSGAASNLWSLIPHNTSSSNQPTSFSYSNLALVVMRIDYKAGNDDAYLFVNPTLGIEPLIANADAKALGMFDYQINRVRPFAGANDAGNSRPYGELYIDELRLGTTYRDVTPFVAVPEPSVVALSLVGLAVLVWRRKH